VPTDRQRILIVDDDPACRAAERHLRPARVEVTVINCLLCASLLVARARPSLIMLNLALPYRSGASWLARLKASPETASIPVVILPALPEVLSRERLVLAQGVVQKPFQTRTLVEAVQAVVQGPTPIDGPLRTDSASSPRPGSL
jgi:two-component system phosphate regulon response regulator PhoB